MLPGEDLSWDSKISWVNLRASQVVIVVKNPPANAGDVRDMSLIPGLRRSAEEGNGNPFQYSWLESSGERSLVGPWEPWGHKESDRTEAV